MRWPVKILILLVLLGVGGFVAIKLAAPPKSTPRAPATPATRPDRTVEPRANPEGSPLPARSGAAPGGDARTREFLRRVATRSRDGSSAPTETNTPGMIRIAQVLESNGSDVAKAKNLLALIPSLTDDDEIMEAAEHAVNLVTDADYAVLHAALINPKLPEPALDELLADLLNRGNSLKLPTLVDLARQPNHPRAIEAGDLLELHVGEDHGTNWSAWLGAIKEHIAEHGE